MDRIDCTDNALIKMSNRKTKNKNNYKTRDEGVSRGRRWEVEQGACGPLFTMLSKTNRKKANNKIRDVRVLCVCSMRVFESVFVYVRVCMYVCVNACIS